jgi:hypothetical protein
MVRSAGNIVEKHIITGKLGNRALADLSDAEFQGWLNESVNAGASRRC